MPAYKTLSPEAGLGILRQMVGERSILAGLAAMHARLGSPFQVPLPGFSPIILANPDHNRRLLVTSRHDFHWRTEGDPVTRLLRHGLLVEDGQAHARLRALMDPALQRGGVHTHIETMLRCTDQVLDTWQAGETRDMLVEMRKTALLILMGALFGKDISIDLEYIWDPILRAIAFISPGPWVFWPKIPRPGYAGPLRKLDDFLFEMIRTRREGSPARPGAGKPPEDLLTKMVRAPFMGDGLIRDQLLTLLIAGHDTSTALLAWALYLLGQHPAARARAASEVDAVLGEGPPTPAQLRQLLYLDAVIKETLRLYPPIHTGNRRAVRDLEFDGHPIPEGARVMYSIYASHRDPQHWTEPDSFRPERFLGGQGGRRHAFAFLPFGGGPRNCIGAAFSQVEARLVLARVLQSFRLEPIAGRVYPHMGATLEPRPGVRMRVYPK